MTAPASRRLRIAVAAVIPLALVTGYVASNASATMSQRALRARWVAAIAGGYVAPAVASTRAIAPGAPVARLVIPAIGLDLIVVEGGNGHRGPAHLPSTVLPGLSGVSIVTGGRFGYGNFFGGLTRLRPGDEIAVENAAGRRALVVTGVTTVPLAAIDAGEDSESPTLELVGPARVWGSSDRLVVRARPEGAA